MFLTDLFIFFNKKIQTFSFAQKKYFLINASKKDILLKKKWLMISKYQNNNVVKNEPYPIFFKNLFSFFFYSFLFSRNSAEFHSPCTVMCYVNRKISIIPNFLNGNCSQGFVFLLYSYGLGYNSLHELLQALSAWVLIYINASWIIHHPLRL